MASKAAFPFQGPFVFGTFEPKEGTGILLYINFRFRIESQDVIEQHPLHLLCNATVGFLVLSPD